MRAFFVLYLLLSTLALFAQEHYLLPENRSDLLHTLQQKISRAHSITIITSKLKVSVLSRSIEKSIHRGGNFKLITTDISSAAYFSKYQRTDIYIPKEESKIGHFALLIMLIDESDLCLGSIALHDQTLKEEISEVTCTTNTEDIAFAQQIIESYTERFERYDLAP